MLSIRGGILGSSIITGITGIFLGALVDANLSTYILGDGCVTRKDASSRTPFSFFPYLVSSWCHGEIFPVWFPKQFRNNQEHLPRCSQKKKTFLNLIQYRRSLPGGALASFGEGLFFFLYILSWGNNTIMIEFTKRRIIKEIKVISHSYNNN